MRNLLLYSGLLLLYHLLFWQEALGLNMLIFGSFSTLFLMHQHRPATGKWFLFLLGMTILSGIALIWHNSVFSIWMFFISIIALQTYIQTGKQSVAENLSSGILAFADPREGIIPGSQLPSGNVKTGVLYMRIALIPLGILMLYVLIFSAGNSIFQSLSGDILDKLGKALANWSVPHILFVILGIVIIRKLFRKKFLHPVKLDVGQDIPRKRRQRPFPFLGLKYEYFSALILFASLNLLFLIVNFIDVKWVWLQFSIPDGFSLKDFVHEGVGWLIFSLLLSISLVLYFFRGNLNRYPGNKPLKALAYLWIAQNAILAISVIIRTLYYIGFHGLASKRIGVLIFISMVLFGLYSLCLKIYYRKNLSHILRLNTIYILSCLVGCALWDWSAITLRYNLQHPVANEIDVDHYLDLNPQVYPVIFENIELVEKQILSHQQNQQRWISYDDPQNFREALREKAHDYLEYRQGLGIFSWTWGDHQAVKKLEETVF